MASYTYHIRQALNGEWQPMLGNKILGRYKTEAEADSHLCRVCPGWGDAVPLAPKAREPKADANHPHFPEFITWLRDTKAGARECPAGKFSKNFKFWLEGGRW